MERRLQAVYKNGVLQPLEALPLEERQQVTVTIVDPGSIGQEIAGYFSPDEWAQAAQDTVSLDEVRRALATSSGSLSDTVIAQREER
ncbi:MAG: antitoxin family protein [Saprospiraceae bacterium]